MTATSQAATQRGRDFSTYADAYDRDGFVFIPNAFDEHDMDLIEAAFSSRLNDPQAPPERLYPQDETILQAHGNSIGDPVIMQLIRESAVADVAQGVFRGGGVWYLSEQAWLKQGGKARRTPWHQDLSYLPFSGNGFAVLWIPLEALAAENVLEIVRGSHQANLYNGTIFEPDNETTPLYDENTMPRLPDIEAERERWDIVSMDMNRGDVLVFHPASLHGGAPTFPGQRRRSMSFRFFSDDAVYTPRPKTRDNEYADTQNERKDRILSGFEGLSPGDSICRSAAFVQVRHQIHQHPDAS